ncbi:MAG TPA: M42 family metallopeptidase [Candidatus Bathyarchaeia archaeon]|nr:M42 family metallopeptidase [Candidatus Bathyarchaeia archaeon]
MDIKELEKWTNAFGPSGYEREVALMVKDYITPYADEVLQDKTGSVIFKKGTKGPKIMIAGHIDEIGFIITGINSEGFLTFNQLGGWWDQVLLGQRVEIRIRDGTKIMGIICSKPPHVLAEEERTKVVTKANMFIDVACKSKKEVEALGLEIGDPVVPYAKFETLKRTQLIKDENGGKAKEQPVTLAIGKAFDDRIGTFIIAEVLKRLKNEKIEHPNQVYGVATVQEEVGLRGARTSAQLIQPDIGFALEVDIAGDVPGVKNTDAPSVLSGGPSILAADGSMLANPQLRYFVLDIAKEKGIKVQHSILGRGGTDAGVMHQTGAGCPSLVFGISTRHIHSHYGILDLGDVEKCIDLFVEVIKRLDQKTVDSFTQL